MYHEILGHFSLALLVVVLFAKFSVILTLELFRSLKWCGCTLGHDDKSYNTPNFIMMHNDILRISRKIFQPVDYNMKDLAFRCPTE